MEVLNDVLGYKNRNIYQNSDSFSFTIDTILLANFVKLKFTTRKILEIGTGTGAIPLVLSLRTKAHIDAVEIQKEVAELAKKTIKYNKLEKQVSIINEDINNFYLEKNNFYDIIVSNPPYYKNIKTKNSKNISKHEVFLNIDDVINTSKCMLKNKGHLFIVYSAERSLELFEKLNKNNLIVKEIRYVYDNLEKEASVVLIECIKDGKEGVKVASPIILKNSDGTNNEIYEIILSGGFLYESKKL